MRQSPPSGKWRRLAFHGLKFYAVGALGVGVQLALLTLLVSVFHFNYLIATFLAVEAAVLHNFIWHQKWTWIDRAHGGLRVVLGRLIKFNLTTGAFSILGNLVFMGLFVGYFHLHYLPAQILTIIACSIINFLVSDRFVFRGKKTHSDDPSEKKEGESFVSIS